MELIIRVVETLAWPSVVLIVLLSLRRPLAELVPTLRRIKYKEIELEFERDLEKLRESTRRSKARAQLPVPSEIPDVEYYLREVRKTSPRNAILEAWLGLEATAVSTATHFRLMPLPSKVTGGMAFGTLRKAKVLNDEDLANINSLRALRNKAVHELSAGISETDAAQFLEIARDICEVIVGEAWRRYGGCSG